MTGDRAGNGAPQRTLALTPVAAAGVVGAFVAAVLLQRAFVAAHRTIGWALACGVVALLLDPVVRWLDRRLPRALAVVVTLLAIVAVLAVVIVGVVRQLDDSLGRLSRTAPDAARRIERRTAFAREIDLSARVASFVDSIEQRLHRATLSRVGTAPSYFITTVLMLFLIAYGRRYVRGALSMIRDDARRARAAGVLRTGLVRGRNALLQTLAQVVLVSAVGDVVLTALGVPTPLILGALIGVLSAIPSLGTVLGAIPALLVTFGFHGAGRTLMLGAVVIGLQTAEELARPRLDRRTVHVGPVLALGALLIGFELYGAGGAVYGYALTVLALAIADAASPDGDVPPDPDTLRAPESDPSDTTTGAG